MEDPMIKIKEKWNLPKKYLDYLISHPKKGEYLEGDLFVDGLRIYSASQLIRNQQGYSYNPLKKQIIEVWPKDYVVIADDGADPYALDLSKSNGEDAPVMFAYHGEGSWDFSEYASSFEEFYKKVKEGKTEDFKMILKQPNKMQID
jgi:hypothetical protein